MKNIIEAIVAAVFGIVIVVTDIITAPSVAVIVLGALLAAAGIGMFIYELVNKGKNN